MTGQGLIAQTFDAIHINTHLALPQGATMGVPLGLLAGDVIANISAFIRTSAAGTAPTLIKFGLVDAASPANVLATTANVKSDVQWTTKSFAYISFALSASYTVPVSGLYYAVILQVGGFSVTQPTLGHGAPFDLSADASRVAGKPPGVLSTSNNQTDISGTVTETDQTYAYPWWFGVS